SAPRAATCIALMFVPPWTWVPAAEHTTAPPRGSAKASSPLRSASLRGNWSGLGGPGRGGRDARNAARRRPVRILRRGRRRLASPPALGRGAGRRTVGARSRGGELMAPQPGGIPSEEDKAPRRDGESPPAKPRTRVPVGAVALVLLLVAGVVAWRLLRRE